MNTILLNVLGLIGGFFFAFCGVPQAWKTLVARKHLKTPVSISGSIVTGSIIMYLYLYLAHGFDIIITINYSVELLSWLILLVFGLRKTKREINI